MAEADLPSEKNMNITAPKKRLALNLKGYTIASPKSPNPKPLLIAELLNCSVRCSVSNCAFALHIPPQTEHINTLEPNDLIHSLQKVSEHDKQRNVPGRS